MSGELIGRLGTALGSDYRIERELGGGGMSRVFLAEDLHLGRQVVVKVLPPEMAAGVNRERFQREIQLAARLQHPHIVPLLSAGSRDDLLWYVMPYVEGESLRARLEREVELPVGEAVRLMCEATDALAYAHDKGVVHRDIKPDNIMLSSGHALVTDFGVAKAVSEAAAGGSGLVTSLGMALGTPAYMAPEQASADPHVDHRADIYALGATAYELLAGRPPFTGPTPQSIFAAHITQTAEPLSSVRPAVPAALETVISRCLEKRPADRWQKASDLLAALDLAVTPSGSLAAVTAARPTSGETARALRTSHPLRVGLLFALTSLLLLSLTWWLVQRLGLPDWVVTAVGVLLLLGFPIVLLAAQRERAHLLARSRGDTVRQQPAGLLGRMLTLRGALAGGGIAFSGLAVGIAVFMGLRIMGIGPFATLVSAGVLKPRDRLVLADFENRTADSALGGSITEAFRIDLAQSPVVRLLETRDVRTSLERMMRPPGSRLDATLAQEVAQREGASAVVAGEIAPLGNGYVLSVRLLEPDGDVLVAERETAGNAGEIIAAVERLSKGLREDIGESLRGLRAEEPLEQVSTASLQALRLYSDAERANNAGRGLESVRLLEQALAEDSTFAMAWRKLAVVLGNWGFDPDRREFAARRAWELRDRLPRREGALATAYYFHNSGRRAEGIDAYRQLLAVWPDDGPSRNNLALLLNNEGQFAEAEALMQEALDSGSTLPANYDNLLDAQFAQRKYQAAESTIALFVRRRPEHTLRWNFGSRLAQVRGDYGKALAFADSASKSDDPARRAAALDVMALLYRLQGRLREAEVAGREKVTADEQGGRGSPAASRLIQVMNQVLAEAGLLGRTDAARRRLAAALERDPLDSIPTAGRPYALLIFTHVILGNVEAATALQDRFRKAGIRAPFYSGDTLWTGGMIALAQGRPSDAIISLRRSARAWGCPICNLVQIGQAFERLEQADSALAAYEQYVTHPMYEPMGQEVDLAPTWIRIGELYEQRGDRARALEAYGKFLDMWKQADPELQPRVAEIRKRVAELAGEPRT